jgi:hypothetical protein
VRKEKIKKGQDVLDRASVESCHMISSLALSKNFVDSQNSWKWQAVQILRGRKVYVEDWDCT